MTPEQKDLLLRDLCARLPYGVKVICETEKSIFEVEAITSYSCVCPKDKNYLHNIDDDEIKPCLFPMSSMTDEDYAIYSKIWEDTGKTAYLEGCHHLISTIKAYKTATDFLLSKHYDINGLIPMGLANDATGLNIY